MVLLVNLIETIRGIPAAMLIIPILALPHIFYGILWKFPKKWVSIAAGKETDSVAQGNLACDLMAKTTHALKLLQAVALAIWMGRYTDVFTAQYLTSTVLTEPMQVLAAVALVLIGQSFNVAIYRAIGKNGVYYGNRFGAQLGPWCTGFPFNMPNPIGRHPQYFGVLCTIWGLVLVCNQSQAAREAGLLSLAGIWSFFYFATALLESGVEETGNKKKETKKE